MIVSQRDGKWGSIKLGTSTTTIGSHGCTITSLGFLVGLTPDKVNTRLNEDGTFILNEDGTSKIVLEELAVSAIRLLSLLGVG